jgi:hypothetical protein
MRPMGFLTGVVLGSAASISLVLLMVIAVFAFSAGGRPEIGAEYPGLFAAAALFGVLAAASGAALVGLQRERPWRWVAQGGMWLVLAAIAWFYWPEGGSPGG